MGKQTPQGNVTVEEVKAMTENSMTDMQLLADEAQSTGQRRVLSLNDVAPAMPRMKNEDVFKLSSFYLIGAELITTEQGGRQQPTIVFAFTSDEVDEPHVFMMSLNRADGNPHTQRLQLYEALSSDHNLTVGPVRLAQIPSGKGQPAWAFQAADTQPSLPAQGKANK